MLNLCMFVSIRTFFQALQQAQVAPEAPQGAYRRGVQQQIHKGNDDLRWEMPLYGGFIALGVPPKMDGL